MKKILFVSLLAVIGFTSNAQTVGNYDGFNMGNSDLHDTAPVVWYDLTDGKVHFSITFYFPSVNYTYEEADAGIWYVGSYPYNDLPSTGLSEYFDPCEDPIPLEAKYYEGTVDVSGITSTTNIRLAYSANLAVDNNISAGYNAYGEFTFDFTP